MGKHLRTLTILAALVVTVGILTPAPSQAQYIIYGYGSPYGWNPYGAYYENYYWTYPTYRYGSAPVYEYPVSYYQYHHRYASRPYRVWYSSPPPAYPSSYYSPGGMYRSY